MHVHNHHFVECDIQKKEVPKGRIEETFADRLPRKFRI
jgi:hypothetical protein